MTDPKDKEYTFTEADIPSWYLPLERPYEENVLVYGQPLADEFEKLKKLPKEELQGAFYEIKSISNGTVTIGKPKSTEGE